MDPPVGSWKVMIGSRAKMAIKEAAMLEIEESLQAKFNYRVKRLLNDNKLEGQVPEQLYSIGVHGGVIDLSGNKGLCGVPSLPECPMLWHNDGLSEGALAIKRNRYHRQKTLMVLEMESQMLKD
ncbi:hypothetical protein V2J09_011099 [Rumex salicifolius]